MRSCAHRRIYIAMLFVLTLGWLRAHAQTTGAIEGRVLDARTGAPVAGAVIAAASPSLQGGQIALSDSAGAFTLALLPPGTYELRVSHESYTDALLHEISVPLDRSVRAEFSLVPSFTESLEVRGSRPIVPLDSQGGTTITRQQLSLVPYGRDTRTFEAAALSVPGVQADLYGLQIRGSSSTESSVLIDGINVADVNFGFQGTTLSQEFIDQVEVKTGGFRAEHGRSMGGIINAITKSGGNEFHGSIFVNGSPLEARRTPVGGIGEAIAVRTSQRYNLDFGATLGGRIMRDKLWFFAGFAPQIASTNVDRVIQARREGSSGQPLTGPEGSAVTDEVARTRYVRTQTSYMFAGKLTWLAAEDHRVSLAVYGNPTRSTGPNDIVGFGEVPVGTISPDRIRGNESSFLFDTITGSTDISITYAGRLFDGSMLIEAIAGLHRQTRDFRFHDTQGVPAATLAATPSVLWTDTRNLLDPAFQDATTPAGQRALAACQVKPDGFDPCPVTGYTTGGIGNYSPTDAMRLSLGLKLTQLFNDGWKGHHRVKYGADVAFDRIDKSRNLTGGGNYIFQDGIFQSAWLVPDPNTFPWTEQQVAEQTIYGTHRLSRGASVAAFLQDSWSPVHSLLVDLGVRVEQQLLYADRSTIDPVTLAPVRGAQIRLTNWMPRVGLSWDFTGRGLARVYGAAGRYYESIPLSLADIGLAPPNAYGASFAASSCAAKVAPLLARDPRFCAPISGSVFPFAREYVDPALQGQYLDEVQGGIQVQPRRDLVIGVEYTHRALGRVIEDVTNDYLNSPFYITNPGVTGGHGYILLPDGSPAIPSRVYDAVTISANKTFTQNWLLGASYTYSALRGNYPGLFVNENHGQIWPNSSASADSAIFFTNAYGPLDGDSRHSFKIDGGWSKPLGARTTVQVGAAFRAQQGTPISYFNGWFGLPALFTLPRGSGGRLPWVTQLDARVAISRDIGNGYSVALSLDVFNLLDSQTPIAVDQTYSYQDLVPLASNSQLPGTPCTRQADLMSCIVTGNEAPLQANPRWGKPTAYQLPLSMRLGARLSF